MTNAMMQQWTMGFVLTPKLNMWTIMIGHARMGSRCAHLHWPVAKLHFAFAISQFFICVGVFRSLSEKMSKIFMQYDMNIKYLNFDLKRINP
jgi:hypothetical protein